MKLRIPTLDMFVWIALSTAGLVLLGLLVWVFKGPSISVINQSQMVPAALGPLTGLQCKHPDRRPIAVMLASDPEARPLSGLAAADMVFEMPVTPNGITRLMAVYQCANDPKEIGSIRSARQDFIPLAQGLGAILAHWGGEHEALDHLNAHVIDNIDALIYEGSVFYRKNNIPRPHNGFTTLTLLADQAAKLRYAATSTLAPYPHEAGTSALNLGNIVDRVTVSWPQKMDVEYRYDGTTNTYARWRGGTPEIDANTKAQVSAGVVIVMDTESKFLRDQYISVRTTGQGTATIYQSGRRIDAHWNKSRPEDMLTFTDTNGRPIPLTPGTIWVEIAPPLPSI